MVLLHCKQPRYEDALWQEIGPRSRLCCVLLQTASDDGVLVGAWQTKKCGESGESGTFLGRVPGCPNSGGRGCHFPLLGRRSGLYKWVRTPCDFLLQPLLRRFSRVGASWRNPAIVPPKVAFGQGVMLFRKSALAIAASASAISGAPLEKRASPGTYRARAVMSAACTYSRPSFGGRLQ
jgi:hypothetical protein